VFGKKSLWVLKESIKIIRFANQSSFEFFAAINYYYFFCSSLIIKLMASRFEFWVTKTTTTKTETKLSKMAKKSNLLLTAIRFHLF